MRTKYWRIIIAATTAVTAGTTPASEHSMPFTPEQSLGK
jgi:hypothetical protein